MASGKKNYFRHSFFARNDIKLKMLRDEIGVGAYFYFFTLLEQCGEASSDELKANYEFHDSTIRSLWNESLPKSMKICEKLMEVGLCSYKKYEKSFYFELPNLSKYLGHYQSKFPPNILEHSSKERKGKERKVKEKKEKNSEDKSSVPVFDLNEIYNAYPRKEGRKKGMARLEQVVKDSEIYEKVLQATRNYASTVLNTEKQFIKQFSTFTNCWEDYLEIVVEKEQSLEELKNELFENWSA